MNQEIKELINIVEPYMDKTLSKGCMVELPFYGTGGGQAEAYELQHSGYFETDDFFKRTHGTVIDNGHIAKISQGFNKQKIDITVFTIIDLRGDILRNIAQEGHPFNRYGECYSEMSTILGHLDITAVLKYITSKAYFCEVFPTEELIYVTKSLEHESDSIPLKPISLYNKEELTTLIKLLKEL